MPVSRVIAHGRTTGRSNFAANLQEYQPEWQSRFHDHPDAEAFALTNRVNIQIPIGSALKYGRLPGEVDVYPRLVGTSEWDTAAGRRCLRLLVGAF